MEDRLDRWQQGPPQQEYDPEPEPKPRGLEGDGSRPVELYPPTHSQ